MAVMVLTTIETVRLFENSTHIHFIWDDQHIVIMFDFEPIKNEVTVATES